MTRLGVAAVAIPAAIYAVAASRAPAPVSTPRAWTASIVLDAVEIPSLSDGQEERGVRAVHPDLERISGWISAVGAAIALFDHDGDGLANDYCLVDPRFDSVTVGPLPGTGARFVPFAVPWRESSGPSTAPMGCLPADLNEDGRQDLVIYYWGRSPTLHFAADGFASTSLTLTHELWHTNAAIVVDVDGDGRLDLMFGNYFPEDAEVIGGSGTPRMQHSMSAARNAGRNRLFRATGAPGSFEDASAALDAAAPNGWTLALGAADLDGDLLPEIYVSNDFGADHLLHNRSRPGQVAFARVEGRRGFTDPRSRVLGRDSFKGMGVDFGDIDRDGHLDIFISNIAEDYALMESHLLFRHTGDTGAFRAGRAPFEEVSGLLGLARSSWAWDARFIDLDNDGWPAVLQATGFLRGEVDRWPELHEVAMGNDELLPLPGVWPDFRPGADLSGDRRDALFLRAPSGIWREAGAALGFAPGTVSRGVALADIDGNGQMDAAIARQWQPSVLLRNRTEPVAPGLVVDARVPLANGASRPAHGARLTLRAADGAGPRLARSVPGGEGHSGKSAPEVHFGLGAFPPETPLVLDVAWRDAGGLHRRAIPIDPRSAPARLKLILDPERDAVDRVAAIRREP